MTVISSRILGRLFPSRYAFALCLVFFFAFQNPASPCSAISSKTSDGVVYFGANYDWRARGGLVFLSPRGQIKGASEFSVGRRQSEATWVSRYASLTVSQFGRDYPMQGINERGLAGAVLMAPAEYPREGLQGVISENLWLQYQLDRFSTIGEVELHLNDFGIKKISADLHWMICDATGECAVVEFNAKRPQIFRGHDRRFRTLTNSRFLESWDFFSTWQDSGHPLPEGYGSLERFVRLAAMQMNSRVVQATEALDDVAFVGFTAWQTIFYMARRSFNIRLAEGSWLEVSFKDMDTRCRERLPMLNLSHGGWVDYDSKTVFELLSRATNGLSKQEFELISSAVSVSENVTCKK